MFRLMYTRDYEDESELSADVEHLRQVLPSNVTGSIFRKNLLVCLHSDDPIDFVELGSPGWELANEDESQSA